MINSTTSDGDNKMVYIVMVLVYGCFFVNILRLLEMQGTGDLPTHVCTHARTHTHTERKPS